jgi:hypothetical protein
MARIYPKTRNVTRLSNLGKSGAIQLRDDLTG